MDALNLAFIAVTFFLGWHNVGSPVIPKPIEQAKMCYQALARDGVGAAICPRDFTSFTMPMPDEHWMVRR